MGKIVSLTRLIRIRRALRKQKRVVVFTNGTFDIIHRGHVDYLTRAKSLGDVLVVGLNTDSSIRRIKGSNRPINNNADRATVLAALAAVDYVCFFGDDTPHRIISRLVPDILVKGADWRVNAIVGKDVVEAHGGKVKTIRLTPGRSTTSVIKRVLKAHGSSNSVSAGSGRR
ncbi:MAG: D-glycero-beta-D-manno-heptose 1-phosphate adenylyltransferase [Ignavibacteriae bacterium]|nr:D-glycero-beta-D-manno-heptose 1-phosphate adenylyltransferase [Ignavibacteriota bacterium]